MRRNARARDSQDLREVDPAAARRLFHLALAKGDFEAARSFLGKCEGDEKFLLAQLAVYDGEPARAVMLLKDRPEPGSRAILGWALFLMNDRVAAARAWRESRDPAEARLGEVLDARIREGESREALVELQRMGDGASVIVAHVSCRLVAESLFSRNQFRKAIHWGRRAEWIMPRDLAAKRLIARAARQAGDKIQARSRWQEIASIDPDDAESQEHLGRMALEDGHGGIAVGHFERALAADPFRSDLRLLLAEIAVEADNFDAAYEQFETAQRMNPGNRDVLWRFAEFCWQNGKVYEAADLFYRLWEAGFTEKDCEENFEILGYLLAEALLAGHDNFSERAEKFFRVAIEIYPDNLYILLYRARCSYVIAGAEEAFRMVEHVLARAPRMPEAMYEMGHILLGEGDAGKALSYLKAAARSDGDPFYRKEVGRCFLELGQWKESERYFKQVLSTGSEDEEVLFGLYAALYYQGKVGGAENLLRRVLVLSPDNMQARCYLAEILLILGRVDDAADLIKEAHARAISYDSFLDGKGSYELVVEPRGVLDWLGGFTALMTGNRRIAERSLRKAIRSAPDVDDWGTALRVRIRECLRSGLLSEALTAELERIMQADSSRFSEQ